jgi:predicted O-methyltransferase YrrM
LKAQRIISFIAHWLNRVDEHSIHSPYFFDFYKKVIRASRYDAPNESIEVIRKSLLEKHTSYPIRDLGAGSQTLPRKPDRTLAQIARASLSSTRLAMLYSAIVRYTEASYILELGTSMGLTTLYLAREKGTRVYTFEGDPTLASVALTHIEMLDVKNIELIEGNLDSTLPDFLQQTDKINFVLMDANHRYEPTLRYFTLLSRRLNEQSIVVVDDIHWSAEMEKAWNELYRHPLVYGSIDLYRCGILFFDPALNKQHFILSL